MTGFQQIEQALSSARLSTYLKATSANTDKALELYFLNAELCCNLWLPLQLYEIVVRNAVDGALASIYGSNWATAKGFQRSLPTYQQALLFESITQAQNEHKNRKSTNNDVVSCCKFYFWELMFSKRFAARLWSKTWKQSFPNCTHADAGSLMLDIQQTTKQIREFRNRIAHHEPIFDLPIAGYLRDIERILGYVSTDLLTLYTQKEQVSESLSKLRTMQKAGSLKKVLMCEEDQELVKIARERLTETSSTAVNLEDL